MHKFSLAAAVGAFAASAALASTVQAGEVEIRNTVARVVVIAEDRTDIQVSVDQGSSGLPAIEIRRRGDDVFIEGGLRRRIQDCRSNVFVGDPTQMPSGVSVEVRDHGRVEMAQAPLIVIRTPMNVDIDAEGAVWGAIGRADNVELGAGGCGDWSVGTVQNSLSVAVGGSGDVRTGTAQALEVAVGGSGEVTINCGRAPAMDIGIGGSGTVIFNGEAGDVDVAIAGSGDVRIARVTGRVERAIVGSGDIRIGE